MTLKSVFSWFWTVPLAFIIFWLGFIIKVYNFHFEANDLALRRFGIHNSLDDKEINIVNNVFFVLELILTSIVGFASFLTILMIIGDCFYFHILL